MRDLILHEVGLRDGLQMEKQVVPIEHKIRWVEQLVASGVDIIQLGSFVHPEKVPQMADTDALFQYFNDGSHARGHTVFSALVLNEKGLERGMNCGVDMFCMGVSASETHSKKNTGMSTAEATDRIIAMAKSAMSHGKRVQVSVQSAFGCGFEGNISADRVLGIVEKYLSEGLTAISFADTAGHAVPEQVESLFTQLQKLNPKAEYACHLHNTYGLGLANCKAAMNADVIIFESAVAGLGGCPFTKVAGGNVCTEDLVHYWHRINRREEIRLDMLIATAKDMAEFFNRELPGLVHKSGTVNYAAAL